MARLDAVYRPVGRSPIDLPDPTVLGVDAETHAVLQAVIELYANPDARTAIRQLFDRCTSSRWAAHLPRDWSTADEFRAHLIHLSARDPGADTRDEILILQALCDQVHQNGIDVAPILDEVASMSSDIDRYGMGSMRHIIHAYGRRTA